MMNDGSRERTLWVGNLGAAVDADLLTELFLQSGPLEGPVKLVSGRDGKSGYAFVTFKHEESVLYACRLFRTQRLLGSELLVKPRQGSCHERQWQEMQASERAADRERTDRAYQDNRHRQHHEHRHRHLPQPPLPPPPPPSFPQLPPPLLPPPTHQHRRQNQRQQRYDDQPADGFRAPSASKPPLLPPPPPQHFQHQQQFDYRQHQQHQGNLKRSSSDSGFYHSRGSSSSKHARF